MCIKLANRDKSQEFETLEQLIKTLKQLPDNSPITAGTFLELTAYANAIYELCETLFCLIQIYNFRSYKSLTESEMLFFIKTMEIFTSRVMQIVQKNIENIPFLSYTQPQGLLQVKPQLFWLFKLKSIFENTERLLKPSYNTSDKDKYGRQIITKQILPAIFRPVGRTAIAPKQPAHLNVPNIIKTRDN